MYLPLAERLRRHLERLAQPRKPRGRPPKDVDYSTCDLSKLRQRINTLRHWLSKSKNPTTIKANAAELLRLKKILKHRTAQQSAATRRNKRNRVLKARAELARQRALDKQAKTKEAILHNWQNRDHSRFGSWLVSSMDEAKAGRVYRPVAEGWAQLTNKVIRTCGYQNGDCTRDSRILNRVRRYDGTTWHETNIRDLNQYRGAVLRAQPSVTSTKPNPADPEPTYRQQGQYGDLPVNPDDSIMSHRERLQWRLEHYPPDYREFRAKWQAWFDRQQKIEPQGGLRKAVQPKTEPKPTEPEDDWLAQHRAKMAEIMAGESPEPPKEEFNIMSISDDQLRRVLDMMARNK